MYDLVAKSDPSILRQQPHQIPFNLRWIGLARQAQKPCYPLDMRVDNHTGRDTPDDTQDDVGGLTSNAGESDEIFELLRDFPTEVMHQHLGYADEVLGFVPKEPGASNQSLDFDLVGATERPRRGKPAEERRRDLVDAHIGALCRQNRGHQELICIPMIQGADSCGIGLIQTMNQLGQSRHLELLRAQRVPLRYRRCRSPARGGCWPLLHAQPHSSGIGNPLNHGRCVNDPSLAGAVFQLRYQFGDRRTLLLPNERVLDLQPDDP